MHIRVECPCGQAYAFDVDPVNNLMPCGVACPDCGADGTELANQFIASTTGVPQAPVPSPAPTAPGLRINRPPPPPPSAPAPPGVASPAPPVPPAPAFSRAYEPPKPLPDNRQAVPRGILGGVLGGGIAMAGWYFLTMASGREFGVAAWFLGVITGVSVRMFARDGSPVLGYIAAVCAGVAILGGEFLVTNAFVNKVAEQVNESTYAEAVKRAGEGVKLQTDAEIKTWIEANDEPEGQVTGQDIDNFRKVRQPKMQDLLNGKPPKADFVQKLNLTGFSIKFAMFKASLSLFTLLWVGFGVASAWRIASK
jgi:hypothetical protein